MEDNGDQNVRRTGIEVNGTTIGNESQSKHSCASNTKDGTITATEQAKDANVESNNDDAKDLQRVKEEGSEIERPLSKRARKRQLKFERVQEYRRQRKEQKKAKKRADAIAAGRDIEAEKRLMEERTKQGGSKVKENREEEWKQRSRGMESRFGICIDCSYEAKMTFKEINSLAQQIRYSYAQNKRSPNPCMFYVSHLSGKTYDLLCKESGFPDHWKSRAFECSELPLVEMMTNNYNKTKKQLIYLTSDSDTELKDLSDDHVYVIGGIVDRNRLKGEALSYAEQQEIQTARLPIDKYIKLSATKVLTCNHVLEILLKYREHGNDWKQAMLDILPTRKEVNGKITTVEQKEESSKEDIKEKD